MPGSTGVVDDTSRPPPKPLTASVDQEQQFKAGLPSGQRTPSFAEPRGPGDQGEHDAGETPIPSSVKPTDINDVAGQDPEAVLHLQLGIAREGQSGDQAGQSFALPCASPWDDYDSQTATASPDRQASSDAVTAKLGDADENADEEFPSSQDGPAANKGGKAGFADEGCPSSDEMLTSKNVPPAREMLVAAAATSQDDLDEYGDEGFASSDEAPAAKSIPVAADMPATNEDDGDDYGDEGFASSDESPAAKEETGNDYEDDDFPASADGPAAEDDGDEYGDESFDEDQPEQQGQPTVEDTPAPAASANVTAADRQDDDDYEGDSFGKEDDDGYGSDEFSGSGDISDGPAPENVRSVSQDDKEDSDSGDEYDDDFSEG